MLALAEGFWEGLDKQLAASASHGLPVVGEVEASSKSELAPAPALVPETIELATVRLPIASAKWSGVLDIINEARLQAETQRDELRKQAETFNLAIKEMRDNADVVWRQVRVLEAQLQESKAASERQLKAAVTKAEDQARSMQAKADEQIAIARQAALKATERAEVAEGWLERISQGARTLVSNREISAIRSAA